MTAQEVYMGVLRRGDRVRTPYGIREVDDLITTSTDKAGERVAVIFGNCFCDISEVEKV